MTYSMNSHSLRSALVFIALVRSLQPASASVESRSFEYEIVEEVLPSLQHGHTELVPHVDIIRWSDSKEHSPSVGLWTGVTSSNKDLQSPAIVQMQPTNSVDVGFRWRSAARRGQRLNVSAWTSVQGSDFTSYNKNALNQTPNWSTLPPLSYSTSVEVQWSGKKGPFSTEFGAIGVQFQRDTKLLLRVRKGGPMIYYRAKF